MKKFLLLCQVGWLTALLYHEKSQKEFGKEIIANKSYFGYSVTFTADNNRLIVSAPKGNDVGALFTCDIYSKHCSEIPTQIDAPRNFHIWLGATVRAGSNFFATCAPRYLERKSKNGIYSRCYKYYTKKYNGLMKLKDKEMSDIMKFEHKMLTSGWSMDVDDNDDVLVGGPAMFTGRATKYEFKRGEVAKFPPILINNGGVKSNFGYSVMHRIYKKQKELMISSTYGEHGFGMVFLYNDANGAIINKINGKQVGSMFGASLCAATVDSSGQSVILVGSPTYAAENMFNTGAVFIYKGHDTNVYREVLGKSNNGQFGYALANVGDLNGDKKDEIAISAPYEEDGRGAVYIYSGAHLMDRDKQAPWLQRIQKEEYRAFGLSLYAVPDYDKNGCKELAIGVPHSNTTILLNCLATITVTVKELRAKGKSTDTPAGFGSFVFESCLEFQYPDLPKIIQANFSVQVDISNLNIRISERYAKDTITYYTHVTPEKRQEYCQNLTVSVSIDKSYDPTIYYQISAILLDDPRDMESFSPTRVTTSDLSALSLPGSAWIGECVSGKRCVPKLEMFVNLSVSDKVPYMVGSTDEEILQISVKNRGDPAYSACITIHLRDVTLLNWPVSCMLPTSDSDVTLICNPNRLLRNNTSWNINAIKLDTKSIISKAEDGDKSFGVAVRLYKDCSGRDRQIWRKNILMHRNSERVSLMGLIKHGGVINITRNEIETSSKQIQHEYVIYNNGPTTWHNIKFNISLQKEFFLDGISTISELGYECPSYEETDKEYINHCEIIALKKNQKFEIVLPIDIMSNVFETLKKKELNVTSHLKFMLGADEKSGSVTTTLCFYEIQVPTWILIVAVLFGLLIIVILAFALYECGFLRRKKKEDLRELRKSIKRQSMRQSRTIEHNDRDKSDQEKLVQISEENNTDDDGPSTSLKAEAHENIEDKNEADNDITVISCKKHLDCGGDTKKKDMVESKTDPFVKTDNSKGRKNDPLAGIIIGGLQKNLRRREILPGVQDDLLVD